MNRARLFMGGLFTVLSLSAAPAFARPAIHVEDAHSEGYRAGGHFDQALEAEIFAIINAQRVRRGLPEMREDPRSRKVAQQITREAGREGGFEAIDEGLRERLQDQGLSTNDRSYGEALAIAYEDEDVQLLARRVVKKWLKTPKYSKVLLSSELTYGSVSAYVNRHGEVMIALDAFGPARIPVPAPVPAPQRPPSCGGY